MIKTNLVIWTIWEDEADIRAEAVSELVIIDDELFFTICAHADY